VTAVLPSTFRAIYSHARKACRSLPPESPVFAIDWNPEKRRDSGMGPDDLPSWFEQVSAIDNPLRRELHLLILLSGRHSDRGCLNTAILRPQHCVPFPRCM
jgi:hypothetical protein